MIRTSKKFIAILLTLAMIFTLAACGKDKTTDTGNDTKATPTEAAPTEVPVVDNYEAFDFGERTIKVGVWWDYFYTSVHTDINEDPLLTNTETAQMKLDNVRRIEEKYNCRIEFVNLGWDGIMSSINTSVTAGTPECDIYETDLQFGIPAVLNGLAQDITTFASENSDLYGDQKIIKFLKAEGKEILGKGEYFFTEQGPAQTGIFLGYNATMINDLGLEDPQALYNKGEWTWEKFAEYAKAGTKDVDNDGTTDIYGFGGVFTDLVNGLVLNNGGSIVQGDMEGLSSTPVVESFEFINQLYNTDKSARPWNGNDWNDNMLAWSDGKVMFWSAQAWLLKQEIDAARAEGAELPFEFHVVPYPTGPSGDGVPTSPTIGNWYIIPVGVQEPGKVLQIYEEFLNWHGGDSEYRDDPTWFESCFTTMEDVDIAYKCCANLKMDTWGSYAGFFDFGGAIWWPIVVRYDTTVAQAVEAAKPVLQGTLDYFKEKRNK